jgi:hypothetical protein
VNKEIEMPRISQVRAILLFCCFIGLAFSDVKALRKDNIITGIDGKQWIQKRQTKTNVLSNIPWLDVPIRLQEKYANHDKVNTYKALLPVPSNQKMNAFT